MNAERISSLFDLLHMFKQNYELYKPSSGVSMAEVENFSFAINPLRHCEIFHRTDCYNRKTALKLFLWYIKGDRNDCSIEEVIPFYKSAKNDQKPYFNSNYGHTMFFNKMILHCINELSLNSYSRRACFVINDNRVIKSHCNDQLCTNAVMFRIRGNSLNMTVQMRSNHLTKMAPYDIFCFCMAYAIVYNELTHVYPELTVGTYFHTCGSMHCELEEYDKLRVQFSSIYTNTPPNFRPFNFDSDNFRLKNIRGFFETLISKMP